MGLVKVQISRHEWVWFRSADACLDACLLYWVGAYVAWFLFPLSVPECHLSWGDDICSQDIKLVQVRAVFTPYHLYLQKYPAVTLNKFRSRPSGNGAVHALSPYMGHMHLTYLHNYIYVYLYSLHLACENLWGAIKLVPIKSVFLLGF